MINKKYDITAFGEILIDFTYVGKSKNNKKLFEQNPGGAPANVLVAATKLGSNTAFLGKAGVDMHGEYLKETLHKESINTSGFIVDKNYFTTLAFVDLNENKERSFSFARKPGADTQLTKEELNINVIRESKIFHVGSLSLTHEPSRSTTHYAIKVARDNGCIISYDPNYRASLWESKDIAQEHIRSIIPDLIKISDEETLLVTGVEDYKEASKVLFNIGIKIVVVTLGSKGCYVFNKDGGKVVSGFKSNVEDTTGAGDAFWGGFLNQIVSSTLKLNEITLEELERYCNFANAVASICVEKTGAIPAMPTLEEVTNRLNK